MNALNLIAAKLASPKTHSVVTTYECGKTRRHDTHGAAAAENYAAGERRRIGRKVIERDTGRDVCVKSVTIEVM